jgi:RNA polymerase sigma factor (sigma-70 family)
MHEPSNEEALVVKHTPLVVSIALKFKPIPPNDTDDLVSVGMIGLLKAIRTFEPERGFQFSTHASTVIRNEILRELGRVNANKVHEQLEYGDLSHEPANTCISEYLPDTLSDSDRELLYRRFFLGETLDDIGYSFDNKTKQWASMQIKNIIRKIQSANE